MQPAAGDAGTALGAALHVAPTRASRPRRCTTAALGGAGATTSSRPWLRRRRRAVQRPGRPRRRRRPTCSPPTASSAWFQGRSEFGPRALGHRSLLAHPGRADEPRAAQRRQGPRAVPAGGADGAGRAGAREIFTDGPLPSPYMLFVHDVRREWRDRIPAVVHVDGTARIQTVDPAASRCVAALLRAFERAHRAAGRGQHQPQHRRSADGRRPPGRARAASGRRRSTCWSIGPHLVAAGGLLRPRSAG